MAPHESDHHHEAALAGPCPICNGIEGCDHTVPERRRAFSDLSANQHTDPMAWGALRRAEARLQEKDGQTLFTLESLKWHIADQRKLISIAREALSHRDAINSAESDVWKGDKRQWIKAILVEMSVALEAATAEAEVQAALDKAINEIVGRKASSKTESPDLVCRTCGGWGECGDYAEPSPCPDCNHHHEAGGAPGREDDYYPSHEALRDLVSLISEHDALTGGGPGWAERWKKAVINAEEIVRVEP